MKKTMYLILIIFVLSYCGPKQEKIERIVEEGVEIIVNHLAWKIHKKSCSPS